MEEKKLSRREREMIRHRNEILEVALKLFSEKGYYNVPMQEIARESEFAVGTLYKLFKNKEDLYRALVLEHVTRFHSELETVFKGTEEEYQKIMNFVRTKGRIFAKNADAIRMYFAETRGASFNIKAGLDVEIRKYYDETLSELSKVFNTGIKKGTFRPLDPYYLAISLDGLVNSFLFCWLEDPEKHLFEENVKLIEEIFFKGVIAKQ